jgi:hypothetical protein
VTDQSADPLAELFLSEDLPRGFDGGSYFMQRGAGHDLAERMRGVLSELMGPGPYADLRPYVTALHALVLDLVDVSGAPTNGRRHPAHAELVERLNARTAAAGEPAAPRLSAVK